MTNTQHILHLLSAICGLIGALGLAFEVLWGFPRRSELQHVEAKLAQLKQFLATQEQAIRELPPPYSDGEKGILVRDLREQFGLDTVRLEERAKKLTEGHAEQSFYLGVAGAAFLVTGFFLDVLSAL
jgi:hypothetical protein